MIVYGTVLYGTVSKVQTVAEDVVMAMDGMGCGGSVISIRYQGTDLAA